MDDMRQTIIPKSDQLNADDLIGREMTIKITGVEIKGGQEQPVSIHFEGDNGKPYKACKSMCRVMVSAWGPDSSKYAGRSLTLYRDPKVKWGGMEVGGIRISHMSDIADDMTMALTVTRANKKQFTVRPIISRHTAHDQRPAGSGNTAATSSSPVPAGAVFVDKIEWAYTLQELAKKTTITVAAILKKANVEKAEDLTPEDYAAACEMLKRKAKPA